MLHSKLFIVVLDTCFLVKYIFFYFIIVITYIILIRVCSVLQAAPDSVPARLFLFQLFLPRLFTENQLKPCQKPCLHSMLQQKLFSIICGTQVLKQRLKTTQVPPHPPKTYPFEVLRRVVFSLISTKFWKTRLAAAKAMHLYEILNSYYKMNLS